MKTILDTGTHSVSVPDEAVVENTPPAIRRISVGAFRRRFTLAEKVAIEESTDSTVKVFAEDLRVSSFVDLDHADTIAGVAHLTSLSLIAAGRDAVILADGTDEEAA